jgi:hypothetical protein
MKLIDQFIDELEKLKEYKEKYESQKKDKKTMSDELYQLMLEKYNTMSYEERVAYHKKNICKDCRYGCPYWGPDPDFPEDILKPVPSKKEWIPGTNICEEFEWS